MHGVILLRELSKSLSLKHQLNYLIIQISYFSDQVNLRYPIFIMAFWNSEENKYL